MNNVFDKSPFYVLNKFLVGDISIDDVVEYLKENPRARMLFSFFNVSRLFINSPRLQYLFNKHLNHVFYSNELKNIENELSIISEILKPYQRENSLSIEQLIRQSKWLNKINKIAKENYLTFKALEILFGDKLDTIDIIFMKLLNDYGILKLHELNQLIDELVQNIQKNEGTTVKSIKSIIKRYRDDEYDVEKLVSEINEIKQSQLFNDDEFFEDDKYCIQCPLGKLNLPRVDKEIYGMKNNKIEVFIVGLNPGKDEVIHNRPFIGKSGQVLRKYIHEYLEKNDISYLITNVIQCHTDNENQLLEILNSAGVKSIEDIKCDYIIDYVREYKPDVILAFGKTTTRILENKLPPEYKQKLITLKHPSYYIRKGLNFPNIDEYNNVFRDIVDKKVKNLNQHHQYKATNKNKNIIEVNDISEIPENRLLVDIKILEKQNKFLILTTDEKGTKYYYLMPFKTEFYYNEKGQDSPRHNPHVMKYENLKKLEVHDYKEYEKLKSMLKRKFRNYFEL